ncbi:MAG TPA: cytidylate kinase-like family protein [Terriglobales bacterium]|nr:cytidylate kinase-like family protein [Terriglobales bacterium]
MFRIVTLEREFGCGGGGIACELAGRLGWKLWDGQLTAEIARRAHVAEEAVCLCDERVDSRLYRLAKAFWRGSYERSVPLADSTAFDTDRMVAMMEEITTNIAGEGKAVIVGRGSPFFLRQREDTFRVFTYAHRDEKIRRLMALGKSEEEAEELVDNVDKDRIAYIKHYFNADWPTRSLYHMMINTEMGNEKVVEAILRAMKVLAVSSREPAMRVVR